MTVEEQKRLEAHKSGSFLWWMLWPCLLIVLTQNSVLRKFVLEILI